MTQAAGFMPKRMRGSNAPSAPILNAIRRGGKLKPWNIGAMCAAISDLETTIQANIPKSIEEEQAGADALTRLMDDQRTLIDMLADAHLHDLPEVGAVARLALALKSPGSEDTCEQGIDGLYVSVTTYMAGWTP